jgi:DNA-binding PadR family transcriptional regulator
MLRVMIDDEEFTSLKFTYGILSWINGSNINRLKDIGITVIEAFILESFVSPSDSKTSYEISKSTNRRLRSTLRSLHKMENDGLIIRSSRRKSGFSAYHLTERGKRVYIQLRQSDFIQESISALSASERYELEKTLGIIRSNLNNPTR